MADLGYGWAKKPYCLLKVVHEVRKAGMHERRYRRSPEHLRDPQRVAQLEPGQVVDLCLAAAPAATVLDVGTGSGLFAEIFAQRACQVIGIDVRLEMLHTASRFLPPGRVCQAVAEALPFADGVFDLVFMGYLLHESDDAFRALLEARRVSRRWVAIAEWLYAPGTEGPPLEHRLQPAQVQAWLERAGFAPVRVMTLTQSALYMAPCR